MVRFLAKSRSSPSSSGQPSQPSIVRAAGSALPSFPREDGIIQIKQVHKTYTSGNHALIDLNLEVKRSEFLLITGPSGSGKSTLLKLLYGEERPSQGEVIVDRYPVHRLRGKKLALLRRRLGIVFQDYKLLPRRTVAENLAFVLKVQGYASAEIQRRLPTALKLVGLQHRAQVFPEELSGGEQQRVSIARAIIGMPLILLADEPTGNLDPDNSQQILNILKRLNANGMTVIVTTHDESLLRLANQPILHMQNGRLSKPA
jgi:cell division transport system ATP-binding protein